MRIVTLLLASGTVLIAQNSPSSVSPPSDGGVRGSLTSIFIPPMVHAPFSLTLETEWVRPLGNGGTYTEVNKRRIMRDQAGRIYQERWFLVPKNSKIESHMNLIQIEDPTRHDYYNCDVATKKCYLGMFSESAGTVYKPSMMPSGPLPDGSGYKTAEELGKKDVEGVETVGYRETVTINAGALGNDQPMKTSREFWFAAQLGMNLISILDSPQVGVQKFTVTNLSTSEPEPSFFQVPAGFAVLDKRKEERGSK